MLHIFKLLPVYYCLCFPSTKEFSEKPVLLFVCFHLQDYEDLERKVLGVGNIHWVCNNTKNTVKTYFIKIIQLIKQSVYIISSFFKALDPRRPKLLK